MHSRWALMSQYQISCTAVISKYLNNDPGTDKVILITQKCPR